MRKEAWGVNSTPEYRLKAVMETYCAKNSRHSLEGIIATGYDENGALKSFDVLYEVTEGFQNDDYDVLFVRNDKVSDACMSLLSQGYDVYRVQINPTEHAVVSVKKLPMKEQDYSTRKR